MEDQAEKLREIMRQKKDATGETGSKPAVKPQEKSSDKSRGNERVQSSSSARGGRQARIITVTSGKGGVGKTNLSVNMALAFARMGKKVVVMDADLGLANVNVMLNIIPKYSLYHVIKKQKRIREILVETEYGISIVAGASGFSQIANMGEDERQEFINELDTLSNADIIIIDTGAGVSINVLDFIATADDAVIITTPEPTAITDAYGIIKIIASEYDTLNMGFKLVVNRAKGAAEARGVADRLIKIAGQFLNLKVDYLGFIYDDPAVSQAVLRQKPFIVHDPKCKASLSVQHLVERIDKNKPIETAGFGSMLKNFFNRSQRD
ncbi:MAG: MinD/ParA family protein [Treponema sp.]|jgi:flagellar biosynthesis protein FlhG|nr:MinD/ParA family protein [Treponema sp.]